MPIYADSIVTEATDAELSAMVEENLFALFRAMAGFISGGQLVEQKHLSYHLTAPQNPMFKGVWQARLNEHNADQVIDQTLAWFRSQGAPFLFWWTGTSTTPNDIGHRLMARGLLSYEAQMEDFAPGIVSTNLGAPGMIADLRHMNESVLTQTPPDFKIETVSTPAQLEGFKQVFITSYDIPAWAAQAWLEATLTIGFEHLPWRIYLGTLNGEPVATNILFCGGGVAGVFGVGTIPSARGKGIGAAITLKPLLDARDSGYRYGVLFATKMGVPVYERIGFRLTDARINRYLWRAG